MRASSPARGAISDKGEDGFAQGPDLLHLGADSAEIDVRYTVEPVLGAACDQNG